MTDDTPTPPDQIQDLFLDDEMRTSYMTYAMSVIIQRALPDARDGLKPSQRRILLAMNDLNLGPRAKFRKCAKIAGDTSGNYHPHGEAVVYPTLVRLAQDFNLRYPLIDKQGNFGAVDGSPPAAMRYTEARMSYVAVDMLDDLDKETVDFARNYDDTRDEPQVLPARFPNLLCNGSQGIAVGMATSIPPHNLVEVADAVIALLADPDIDLMGLMVHIKGPDFPTGGTICGRQGVLRAYNTGRGHVVVRARTEVEKKGRDREQIVVTELPYQVNPINVFEKVKTLIADKVIEGIGYVNDETDRRAGLRLVFEIKKGHQADVVLNQLYRFTQLQSNVSIILLALSNGRPRTFTLKEMLEEFRDHRIEVIQRRTRYLKRKAEERLHIVEGLLIAIANIDEVVRIIKTSGSPAEAKTNLMSTFVLSERQAQAILDMRLARLTGLEVEKLEHEKLELEGAIARYAQILGDVREVHKLIVLDLEDLKVRYSGARRTEITDDELEIEDESLIPEGNMLVSMTHQGYIKRMSPDLYRTQARGGVGITGADTKEGDFVERLIIADNKDFFLIFTTWGWVHWLKVWRIPELGRSSQGRFISNLIALRDEDSETGRERERVASIIPVREFDDRYLVTVTRQGFVKKSALADYSRPKRGGIIGVGLKPDDQLVRAVLTDGTKDLLVSTSQAQTIRFSETDVRSMGRSAAGVIAVKFKRESDVVVDMAVADDEATLLTLCANGFGKRTRIDEYPRKRRGGMGVVNIKGLKRNGEVVLVRVTREGENTILMSEQGMIVRIPVDEISLYGRGSQGVRIMRLREGDRVISGVVVSGEEEVEDASGDKPRVPTPAPSDTDSQDDELDPSDEEELEDEEELDDEPESSDTELDREDDGDETPDEG